MAETRDRIIAATNELFRRRGYNGTTLSQISEASNATIGSIYHFFPGGKEDLAAVVITTSGIIYRELFEAIVSEATDPAEAYVDFFSGAAEILEQSAFIDPCPIGTVAREVANTSEPLRVAASAAFDSWIDAAVNHLTDAGLGNDQATELAHLFIATVEGMFVLSRTQRSTTPLQSAGASIRRLVADAIDEATTAARSEPSTEPQRQ